MVVRNTGCVTPVPRGHAARVKPPARVKKIQMHQVQSLFKNSESRLRAFCGGINTGKSWIGAYDLVTRAKPDVYTWFSRLRFLCFATRLGVR